MHVLFVSNGNIGRSPIAERLAHAIAAGLDIPELTAESAGLEAKTGAPIEPVAAQVLIGLGGDPEGFAARPLDSEMVERAQLVLAMTTAIRDKIFEIAPKASSRTFSLLEAHRIARLTGAREVAQLHRSRYDLTLVGNEDIAAPDGLPESAYCRVGDDISESLVPLLLALHPAESTPEPETRNRRPSRKMLILRQHEEPAFSSDLEPAF